MLWKTRPLNIQSVEQIENAWVKYNERLKNNPMEDGQTRPKTLQRFCCFVDGLDISKLYDYINWSHSISSEDQPEYQRIRNAIKRIYDEILGDKVEKLETMKTTPVGLIFSMKNSFNRADKQDFNVKANVSIDKVLNDIIE